VRYVVTGGAGHVGSALVARLAARDETTEVVVADVRHAGPSSDRVRVESVNVRDAQHVTNLLERERPDALVHLGCSHDSVSGRQAMYETDVVGTNAVLAAAAAAGTAHVVALSSAACYAPAEGPEPVTEASPLRSDHESDVARDTATVDRLCQLWAARNTDRTLTLVRPCAVLTSAPDDRVAALFTDPPHAAALAKPETLVQFLHEEDFVDGLAVLASGRHGGIFNLAGDGTVALGDCTRLIGLKGRGAGLRVYSKLRRRNGSREALQELDLLMGTPIVATARIAEAAGWRPRSSSRAAFELAMERRGKLAGDAAKRAALANAQVADERS
jgi:UDP-glucose 4-epimerase